MGQPEHPCQVPSWELPSRPSEEHSLHKDQLLLLLTHLYCFSPASGESGCASAEQGHGLTQLVYIPLPPVAS